MVLSRHKKICDRIYCILARWFDRCRLVHFVHRIRVIRPIFVALFREHSRSLMSHKCSENGVCINLVGAFFDIAIDANILLSSYGYTKFYKHCESIYNNYFHRCYTTPWLRSEVFNEIGKSNFNNTIEICIMERYQCGFCTNHFTMLHFIFFRVQINIYCQNIKTTTIRNPHKREKWKTHTSRIVWNSFCTLNRNTQVCHINPGLRPCKPRFKR